MKIGVFGIWHLGSVISACLADKGFEIIGFDRNQKNINNLNNGIAPIFEPDLNNLIKKKVREHNLIYTSKLDTFLNKCEVIFVSFDTPTYKKRAPNYKFVINEIKSILKFLNKNTIMIICSQLPVGSTRLIEEYSYKFYRNLNLNFFYSPENLRLGTSVVNFLSPDRIIVGSRDDKVNAKVKYIFDKITSNVIWMKTEAAEMTKHAINSFLATSVSFANEIALLCEHYNIDAKEVEEGLKSDTRIGKKSYLSPGAPFSGDTFARDLNMLNIISKEKKIPNILLNAVKKSNDKHDNWEIEKLDKLYKDFSKIIFTIWGLTYKENTDTLRGSRMINLINYLSFYNAKINVYDPQIDFLPIKRNQLVTFFKDPVIAADKTDVLIIGTNNKKFDLNFKKLIKNYSKKLIVLDIQRTLNFQKKIDTINYYTVGGRK